MMSIAPLSVVLLAVLGLLVIAFATTRMAYLEHRLRSATRSKTAMPAAVRSTV